MFNRFYQCALTAFLLSCFLTRREKIAVNGVHEQRYMIWRLGVYVCEMFKKIFVSPLAKTVCDVVEFTKLSKVLSLTL